jgi:4-amino-4-deoxy-L-arabinose transferase-like glycosyltransferase
VTFYSRSDDTLVSTESSSPSASYDAPRHPAMSNGPRINRFAEIAWDFWAAVGLLAVHGALVWLNRAPAIGTWRDEANYVMLARSLRHLHYQDFYLLGSPAHSQYPPGFPALLAVASLPFGEHVGLLLAAAALCSVAALAFFYALVRRLSGPIVGLTVLALLAFNPDLIAVAGHLLSDTPFIFLTAIALWAVVRGAANGSLSPPWQGLVVTLAAILAALTRTVGVTLIAAILAGLLLERRYRFAAVVAVAATITVGSWLVWSVVGSNHIVGRSYVADVTARSQPRTGLATTLLSRVPPNVSAYATTEVPAALPQPTLETFGKHLHWQTSRIQQAVVADKVVSVVALLIFGILGVWVLWRLSRTVVLYLAITCMLLAVWTWPVHRFILPLLPILLWVLVLGAISLAASRRWARPIPVLLVGGILAMAVAHDVQLLRDNLRCDRRSPITSPACFNDVERGFFQAASFIRTATPDSAAFLTAADAQLAYLTGRQTEFFADVAGIAPDSLLGALRDRRVSYVVLTPLRPPQAQLAPTLAAACRELELVREFGGSTLLLRIAPPNSPLRENACESIDRYSRSMINQTLWPPRQRRSAEAAGDGPRVHLDNLDRGE